MSKIRIEILILICIVLLIVPIVIFFMIDTSDPIERSLRNDEKLFEFLLQRSIEESSTVEEFYIEWHEYCRKSREKTLKFIKNRNSLEKPRLVLVALSTVSGGIDENSPPLSLVINWLEDGHDTIGIKLKYSKNEKLRIVSLPVFGGDSFRDAETREALEGTTLRTRGVYIVMGNDICVTSDAEGNSVIEMPREVLIADFFIAVYDNNGNESEYQKPFVRKKARPLLLELGSKLRN